MSIAAVLSCGHLAVMPSALADTDSLHASTPATASIARVSELEGLPAHAMSSTLVKEVKRTVYFAPASAQLDADASEILTTAAMLIPQSATGITIRSVGFVPPHAFWDKDFSLSTKRARVVAAALRRLGVRGAVSVSGRGRAAQSGPEARRAEVVISFTAAG